MNQPLTIVSKKHGWLFVRLLAVLVVVLILGFSAQVSYAESGEDAGAPDTTETSPGVDSAINQATSETSNETEPADDSTGAEPAAGSDEPSPTDLEPINPDPVLDEDPNETSEPTANDESEDASTPPDETQPGDETTETPPVPVITEEEIAEPAPDPVVTEDEIAPGLESDERVDPIDDPLTDNLPLLTDSIVDHSSTMLDPYFDREGTRYYFASNCTGLDNCTLSSTPVQAALDNIKANGMPDDGILWFEAGDFSESITIAGFEDQLTLMGRANGSTKLSGSISVSDSDHIVFDTFDISSTITLTNTLTSLLRVTLYGTAA
jgi:hypothetical protein